MNSFNWVLQVLPLQILECRTATRSVCYIVLVFCCSVWFFLIEELQSWINSLGKFIPLFVPPQGLVQILQNVLRINHVFQCGGERGVHFSEECAFEDEEIVSVTSIILLFS